MGDWTIRDDIAAATQGAAMRHALEAERRTVIRLTPADRLGLIIGRLRKERHLNRSELAWLVAAATGQEFDAVAMQLSRWEGDRTRTPNLATAIHVLQALGYDLAIIPRKANT